jgi:hypothetical protein
VAVWGSSLNVFNEFSFFSTTFLFEKVGGKMKSLGPLAATITLCFGFVLIQEHLQGKKVT